MRCGALEVRFEVCRAWIGLREPAVIRPIVTSPCNARSFVTRSVRSARRSTDDPTPPATVRY